jgi:hypothetical protein
LGTSIVPDLGFPPVNVTEWVRSVKKRFSHISQLFPTISQAPKPVKKPLAPVQPIVVHQRNENIMKARSDLSAKEGRVVLMEYIEENPLVVSNFGMGTKVKNYYRKKNATENPLLKFEVRSFGVLH